MFDHGVGELEQVPGAEAAPSAGRVHPPTAAEALHTLGEVAAALDPDRIDPQTAALLTAEFAHIERLAAASTLRCARRALDAPVWRDEGHRSPAHWLAAVTATTPTAAGQQLEHLSHLDQHADTAAAHATGALSATQVKLIAPAIAEAPDSADDLLRAAGSDSVAELRERCQQVRARAQGPNEEAHHHEQRRRRRAVTHSTADALKALTLASTTDDIAVLTAAIDAFRHAAWSDHARLNPGVEPTAAAIGFDAALLMARHALNDINPNTVPGGSGTPAGSGATDNEEDPGSGTSAGPSSGEGAQGCADPDGLDGPESTDERDGADDPDDGAGSAAQPGMNPGSGERSRRRFSVSPPEQTVRVEISALERGYALPDEICDIPGAGPLPVCVARNLIDTGARIAVVELGDHGIVRRVAHRPKRPSHRQPPDSDDPSPSWWINTTVLIAVPAGAESDDVLGRALLELLHASGRHVDELVSDKRKPTAHQRSALRWRDPTCRVQGCTATARLEIDHHIDWAHQHRTTLPELGRLCHHHHLLRTLHGYTLGTGPGKQPLLPPLPGG